MTAALLAWFRRKARPLPWRRTSDPYAIWISEVMLQQTQVQTVIPYWQRWMAAFPNVQSLARARFERILKLWEGLGYYRRARNLHQAAQIIVQERNGAFPDNYDTILSLPGIGRYTAGAICSIAFDQPKPILDGNIIRVLTRVHGISGNVKSTRVNRRLWNLAQDLVETAARLRKQPGSCPMLNQALMELGAMVCTPKQPNCESCPIHLCCVAQRTGQIARFPTITRSRKPIQRRFIAFVPYHGRRIFVRQRPAGVVNAHLWEFPNVEVSGTTHSPAELASKYLGCGPAMLEPLGTIHHSITRYRISVDAYRMAVPAAELNHGLQGRWQTMRQLERLPFPSAHRKILLALRNTFGVQM